MSQQQELKVQLPATRGYQQEMLDESLRRNVVIALDTGSGKTHIAVLRMKVEMEREQKKVGASLNTIMWNPDAVLDVGSVKHSEITRQRVDHDQQSRFARLGIRGSPCGELLSADGAYELPERCDDLGIRGWEGEWEGEVLWMGGGVGNVGEGTGDSAVGDRCYNVFFSFTIKGTHKCRRLTANNDIRTLPVQVPHHRIDTMGRVWDQNDFIFLRTNQLRQLSSYRG